MEPTSAALTEDTQAVPAAYSVALAKTYGVGQAAVHALAGVMEDKHAAKGVLVTTSWVGKASRDFAARNGSRIQIIEGRQLKYMLKEHLGLDVLISLPKLPPDWDRQDVS